jgi:hypothetical protein
MGTSLGPIGQIARSVKDIEAAEAWHRDVLKMPHLLAFGDLAFFYCDGLRLSISKTRFDRCARLSLQRCSRVPYRRARSPGRYRGTHRCE